MIPDETGLKSEGWKHLAVKPTSDKACYPGEGKIGVFVRPYARCLTLETVAIAGHSRFTIAAVSGF